MTSPLFIKSFVFDINALQKLKCVTVHWQCVTDALIYSCFGAPQPRLVQAAGILPACLTADTAFLCIPIDSAALSDRWV